MSRKTVFELPKDIYALFDPETHHEVNEDNVEKAGEAFKEILRTRLQLREDDPDRVLRFSSLGKKDRQIWYEAKQAEAEALAPKTYFKFLYGDVIEVLLLFLAEEAGHTVERQQEEIVVDGITGHIDAIIGGSPRDGKEVKARFVSNFPGLAELLNDLERQVERTGRIRLCDGTPLAVTQPHTRLGYLLQGDESRIMKQAAIFSHQEIVRRKLDVLKVGDIHDEWQNDVGENSVEELTKSVFPESFARSGQFFRYNLPIECDSKVGLTWAQTH